MLKNLFFQGGQVHQEPGKLFNADGMCWKDTLERKKSPRLCGLFIVGKPAYGKTTMLLNLLFNPEWLDYDNLQVFGRSLFQPEYKILKKAFENKLQKEAIIGLFRCQNEILRLSLLPTSVVAEMGQSLNSQSD